MSDTEKKFPKVATGIFVFNQAGKVFLMRSPHKFGNQYYIPGGHVDWGESLVDCAVRETKEETGLDIYDVEFLRPVEFVFYELYSKDKHFISFNCTAKTKAAEDDVVLDGREGTEYIWLKPEEVAGRTDVEKITKEGIQVYLAKQKEKGSDEYKQGWQRAVADYQNLQKETRERRQEWVEMSEQQILEEFIPVYNNFKKAFAHHPNIGGENEKQLQNWINGIGFIQRQFAEVMRAHKVEEIKTVGEKFDPAFHEAVGSEASDQAHGIILKEIDGGYTMNGRVIKVAKVIIAE